MRILLTALGIMFGACVSMAEANLPKSIHHLQELANDEVELIDATRRYHLQQLELNAWDVETAQNYKGDDIQSMHTMLSEKIKKRKDSIKQAWEYVLSLYPKNPKALNYIGEYWYDTVGNHAAGVKHWQQALILQKNYSFPHNNLGLHYFHTGDYRKGLKHLQKALELDPKNPDFLFNAAQMYLTHFPSIMKLSDLDKKTMYKQAMEFSRKAAKYEPEDLSLQQDYATNFYASDNFNVEIDWKDAAKAWQDTYALATRKNDLFFAKLNEGRCWMRAHEKKEAIEALEAAQAIIPTSDVVESLLSKVRRVNEEPSKHKGSKGNKGSISGKAKP